MSQIFIMMSTVDGDCMSDLFYQELIDTETMFLVADNVEGQILASLNSCLKAEIGDSIVFQGDINGRINEVVENDGIDGILVLDDDSDDYSSDDSTEDGVQVQVTEFLDTPPDLIGHQETQNESKPKSNEQENQASEDEGDISFCDTHYSIS